MLAEYDRANNRVLTLELDDGRKISTQEVRVLGTPTEWLPVTTDVPEDYNPVFATLLHQESAAYTFDPSRNAVVAVYPEADFSPSAIRKELATSWRLWARSELAKTDWTVTRLTETGTPIPEQVVKERKEIRDKVDELLAEAEITPDKDLSRLASRLPLMSTRQDMSLVTPVPGTDGTEWVTNATDPSEQGQPVRRVEDQ